MGKMSGHSGCNPVVAKGFRGPVSIGDRDRGAGLQFDEEETVSEKGGDRIRMTDNGREDAVPDLRVAGNEFPYKRKGNRRMTFQMNHPAAVKKSEFFVGVAEVKD